MHFLIDQLFGDASVEGEVGSLEPECEGRRVCFARINVLLRKNPLLEEA